jgi:hypothetical protein
MDAQSGVQVIVSVLAMLLRLTCPVAGEQQEAFECDGTVETLAPRLNALAAHHLRVAHDARDSRSTREATRRMLESFTADDADYATCAVWTASGGVQRIYAYWTAEDSHAPTCDAADLEGAIEHDKDLVLYARARGDIDTERHYRARGARLTRLKAALADLKICPPWGGV